jgi:SET domain-containing protein
MKYLKLFEDFDSIEIPEEEYLYIQLSQIKNAGSGLFTRIKIEEGEVISKFKGEIISSEEAKKRSENSDNDYFMMLPSGNTLDCKRVKCFAKYANDASISDDYENNSIITMDEEDNVVLVANRDIIAGEEIFVGYGKKYWQANKHRL